MSKKLLILNHHGPNQPKIVQAAQELVLAATVYDYQITVIFLADGVRQLLVATDDEAQATLNKNMQAWPLFGINEIYVDSQSLYQQGLQKTDLINIAHEINPLRLKQLLSEQAIVFNF